VVTKGKNFLFIVVIFRKNWRSHGISKTLGKDAAKDIGQPERHKERFQDWRGSTKKIGNEDIPDKSQNPGDKRSRTYERGVFNDFFEHRLIRLRLGVSRIRTPAPSSERLTAYNKPLDTFSLFL
jgi:hypothetical protein